MVFYAWGEPVMVFLMVGTSEVNRLLAILVEKHKGTKKGKLIAIVAISLTLATLAVFKYGGLLHLPFKPSLPIGISFYTFQIIAYMVEVYKGNTKAQKSSLKFLMYISLFPQLIAGPIVRYNLVEQQISGTRPTNVTNISYGITRFTIGLAKKVLLANQLGAAARTVLDGNVVMSVSGAWLGVFLFALQIYYDFSGYSDMAIGLGRIFGFSFPENFNYPYISQSISEFWRRWHMTLGGFFRDYVYIPLGGGRRMVFRNLLITWFLTGLWHGASWNFALWGVYFGVLIIIEKAFLLKVTEKVPALIKIPFTLFFVVFGWALFYYTDFERMWGFIKSLLALNSMPLTDIVTTNLLYDKIAVIIIALLFCMPIYRYIERAIERMRALQYIVPVVNVAIVFLCVIMLVGDTHNPFLYYRF